MNNTRRIVLAAAALLAALWVILNYSRLERSGEFELRFFLSLMFFILVLFRRRLSFAGARVPDEAAAVRAERPGSDRKTVAFASLGLAAAVLGLVFKVHQAEWLGLLLLLYACLRWALPSAYARDIAAALVVLYFVHPPPGNVIEPFQRAMRGWSIAGAEWLMHCFNVRVWSDGEVLRTGFIALAVPDECSGLRAATAVIMCGLGIGLTLRFRYWEIALTLVGGLVQTLALNILRITIMTMVAPELDTEWRRGVLHDTSGILLLAAVFFIQVEASAWSVYASRWRLRKKAVDEGVVESPERGSIFHPFWHMLLVRTKTAGIVLAALFLAACVAGAAYKRRPYHRGMMINDVADRLVLTDLATARAASETAMSLAGGDSDVRMRNIKIKLFCNEYDAAIAELEKTPPAERDVQHTVLKSWALMGLGRPKEAIALVDALPASTRTLPGVAMIRAEYAATEDDIGAVVDNVRIADRSPWMRRRIRALYPYLAARRQWELIASCEDGGGEHEEITSLVIAAHAYLQTGRFADMARIVGHGMKRWPNDGRFVRYLGAAAMMRVGGEWESVFAEKFKLHLNTFVPDDLAVYAEQCFRMNRPDLSWLAYRRLVEIDPSDPALSLLVAQFGDRWFTFRRRHVGLPSAGPYDTIDLTGFCLMRTNWPAIPLRQEITGPGFHDFRKRRLAACLDELERREAAGKLSRSMRRLRVEALRLAGRDADAKTEERAIMRDMPRTDEERQAGVIREKMRVEGAAAAWRLLEPALRSRPGEPEFMSCLAALAAANPGSEFEKIFETSLRASIPARPGRDMLAVCMEGGFAMGRPDLAWLAFETLSKTDARDPELLLAPVRHSTAWFVFRNEAAGIAGANRHERTNLRKMCVESEDWPSAPLAREIAQSDGPAMFRKHLGMALSELKRREAAGKLSLRMQIIYATALGMNGDFAAAHARLDVIAQEYPDQARETLYQHALFYGRDGRWAKVYEALRQYSAIATQPRLDADLLRIEALMRLNVGAYAMAAVEKAAAIYPGAPEIRRARAAIWAACGDHEQALYEMRDLAYRSGDPLVIGALEETGRRLPGGAAPDRKGVRRETMLLPAAETSLEPQWENALDSVAMEREALMCAKTAESSESPYFAAMAGLKKDWYRQAGGGKSSDPGKWMAAGRDTAEKTFLLYELGCLLARNGELQEAAAIVDRALELAPESAVLRRMQVTLRTDKTQAVADARRVCPADPEIWLAALVLKAQTVKTGDWAAVEMKAVCDGSLFSVGAIVRAGDFLMRSGMLKAAEVAARHAVAEAQGLLPAYVLGMRCGLKMNDIQWAVACAMRAADVASNPDPFHSLVVELDRAGAGVDERIVIMALEKLIERHPSSDAWRARLGEMYLRAGDARRAATALEQFAAGHEDVVELRTRLLAAEAARRFGNTARSVAILEIVHRRYPDNPVVLNNLVYSLAFDKDNLPRALKLLPELMAKWGSTAAANDTAAIVYRNSGDMKAAKKHLLKAADLLEETDSGWLRSNPKVVDLDAYIGNYDYSIDRTVSELRKRELGQLLLSAEKATRGIERRIRE